MSPAGAADYEERRGRALMKLRALAIGIDPETAHRDADEILLALLDDPEIQEAFEAVPRGFWISEQEALAKRGPARGAR